MEWQNIFSLISDNDEISEFTDKYRLLMQHGHTDEAQNVKKRCLAFTPAVECGASRKPADFVGLTGIGMCDFDHLSDISAAIARVKADRHAFMVYKTISGNGVRVLFRYIFTDGVGDYKCYRAAFESGNAYFSNLIGAPCDAQCKNVGRLSVISHDAEALFNEDSVPFEVSVKEFGNKKIIARNTRIANSQQKLQRMLNAILKRLDIDGISYQTGNRNHYISNVGYYLNKLGADEQAATEWATERFSDFDAFELAAVMHSCFSNVDEFRCMNIQMLEAMNRRDTEKSHDGMCSVTEIEDFLLSQAKFRHNVITRKIEVCMLEDCSPDKPEVWKDMTDRMENTLWARMCKLDKKVNLLYMHGIINSEFAEEWNPFTHYFNSLPEWDGKTDYISELADMVTVKQEYGDESQEVTQERFRNCFRKWLIACVVSLQVEHVVNNAILVFIGRQGSFKTTYMSKLLPPELSSYFYTKTNSDRMTKDDKLTLAEYAIMCLEELDSMRSTELNQLKALATDRIISERAAYARYKENRPHLASFCGTGNNKQFLTDQTGNRRWLPFEVEHIENPIYHHYNYEGIYSQAMALWHNKECYWFDDAEIDELIDHLIAFEVPNVEEELIATYFRVPKAGEPFLLMNATNIIEQINVFIKQALSTVKIGIAMKKLGFELVRRNKGRYFKVVKNITTTQDPPYLRRAVNSPSSSIVF